MGFSLRAFPILALALACVAFSQEKPNAASAGRDSMQQMMPASCQAAKAGCMSGHEGISGMKEGMMRGPQVCGGDFMPGACCCMQGQRFMQQGHFMAQHPLRFRLCLAALFLIIALVNILLTILVCVDMAKLGAFNAIWIPILLLFGIPGTGLYALFRIGDMVKGAAGK